jgi:hypothetical protein
MKKVSAVEWLAQQLESITQDLFEQAKEIEKQQMKNAVLAQTTKHEGLRKIFEKQFEQYYNETFKK